MKGGSRTPEFLAMNPNGRIPLLEVPGRGFLPESHAIISFLAEGSHLIPTDAFERARMWHWMCFEQYHVEPNIGTVRFWISILRKTRTELGEKLVEKKKSGYAALDVLEEGLSGRTYLVDEKYSLADISLFAYTHVAHEGGFDLAPYPNVRGWIERVVSQPKWEPITHA
jgi:glutathione S-transferase